MKPLKCHVCDKELNQFDFPSLRKYREINDEEVLEKAYDICSAKCARGLSDKGIDLKDFYLYEIRRCVGYYDCMKLDNLRRMCETKNLAQEREGIFSMIHLPLMPECNPAEVGIIKSNVRLLNLFKKFDEVSTKYSEETLRHTRTMKRLTWWILGFTIINVVLLIFQILKLLGVF